MLGGGVPAVARFLKDTIIADNTFDLRVISLATSARDPCNLSLATPRTWLRGATTHQMEWESLSCTHVGARFGELEFQRYRPRAALQRALAGCDIIQMVCGSPAWANAALGLGVPVALQVATRARIERRSRERSARGPQARWRRMMTHVTDRMDARALRGVDAIQVENPWMLEYARRITSQQAADLRYAPPGIDATFFQPLPTRSKPTRPYILSVARFADARKNPNLLLNAFARLPVPLRNSVELVLAGADMPPIGFWQEAERLGLHQHIRQVPHPDDAYLLELYRNASVFTLPSDEEGLGVVILEAMACGVPAVATRCGGPDGIISDGDDGYLVPLNDAEAMAARWQSLLLDDERRATMGARARQTIESRYDQRIAGAVFIDMWQRLLHKRSYA